MFFDEIQDCPNAIVSLRYFFEEIPDLHIIGAGSLLEFALKRENIKIPVGRIQYLYMFPLSFEEFLDAMGETVLKEHIFDKSNLYKLVETLHDKLVNLTRKYFIIGGMPAVMKVYISSGDILKCQKIQQSILATYIDDFGKYSSIIKFSFLNKFFYSVPSMVGQKFIYARVDNNIRSRELKEAVELLETAGVITRVKCTGGAGLPLEAGVKTKFYKLIFLDVGLLHAISGIYNETVIEKDFTAIFKSAVAEQFVGQELLTTGNPYIKPSLYYWIREAKSSNAEIDYLIQKDNGIIPIEVKSGSSGKLKSMHIFLNTFKSKYGIKISQAFYSDDETIISLPFYAIKNIMKN